MRETPDDIQAGIGALEAAAGHMHAIEAIRDWPNLTPRQRIVALVISSLEYVSRRPPGSLDVARYCGLEQVAVEKIFDGHDRPPFYWSEIPGTRSWAFLPSQGLEYGDAEG